MDAAFNIMYLDEHTVSERSYLCHTFISYIHVIHSRARTYRERSQCDHHEAGPRGEASQRGHRVVSRHYTRALARRTWHPQIVQTASSSGGMPNTSVKEPKHHDVKRPNMCRVRPDFLKSVQICEVPHISCLMPHTSTPHTSYLMQQTTLF